MMYGSDGPRTWKYAVPATMAILLGWEAWSLPAGSVGLAVLCLAFSGLFGLMALTNWWKLFTSHKTEMYMDRQIALSKTPLVLLAENMKQMHPEAVRVLNRFGVRTSWQVRVGKNFGERDWVLADTNVHFGFIEFVMSMSSKTALYGKRTFNRGSMKWDPDGLVEDREQFDELEKWLFARMMVTRSHGDYKPAEFIPPWTPALILETLGLTGEQDLYRPEEDPRKDLGKDLGATSSPAAQPATSAGSAPAGRVSTKDDARDDLTEDEIRAIELEMTRHADQYSS